MHRRLINGHDSTCRERDSHAQAPHQPWARTLREVQPSNLANRTIICELTLMMKVGIPGNESLKLSVGTPTSPRYLFHVLCLATIPGPCSGRTELRIALFLRSA
jgi:hypothetical protein